MNVLHNYSSRQATLFDDFERRKVWRILRGCATQKELELAYRKPIVGSCYTLRKSAKLYEEKFFIPSPQ